MPRAVKGIAVGSSSSQSTTSSFVGQPQKTLKHKFADTAASVPPSAKRLRLPPTVRIPCGTLPSTTEIDPSYLLESIAETEVVGSTTRVFLFVTHPAVTSKKGVKRGANSRGARIGELLLLLDRSRAQWDDQEAVFEPVVTNEILLDGRSVSEVYSSLPSPRPCSSRIVGPRESPKSHYLRRILAPNWKGPDGLLDTDLYEYQVRDVQELLLTELSLRIVPDPAFHSLLDVDGLPYFVDFSTGRVARFVDYFPLPQSGILCEEMGRGKTVIVLALILATLSQLPEPPTPYGSPPRSTWMAASATGGPPPLANAALHVLTTDPIFALPSKERLPEPQCIMLDAKWEDRERGAWCFVPAPATRGQRGLEVDGLQVADGSGSADQTPAGFLRLELASTTLVLVPDNLLIQWIEAIGRHVQPGALRILVLAIDARAQPLPTAKAMANDFDIIIVSFNRFSAEEAKGGFDPFPTAVKRKCDCPYIGATLIRDCRCPKPPLPSPFTKVRWKRLVIDEGHIAHARHSNLMTLAAKLSVERCWVVSGTPTPNTVGLDLSVLGSRLQNSGPPTPVQGRRASEASPSRQHISPLSSPPATSTRTSGSVSPWAAAQDKDVRRLGSIISRFFQFPSMDWTKTVVEPLRIGKGAPPDYGAVKRLDDLMQLFMVRTRSEDIDAPLPPLEVKVIMLDLEPAARITYNVLQSLVIVNSITANRIGDEWLFGRSKRSVEAFASALTNISHSCFWFTTDAQSSGARSLTQAELEEQDLTVQASFALGNVRDALLRGRPLGEDELSFSAHDRAMLEAAERCLAEADRDATWKQLLRSHGAALPIFASGLPPELVSDSGLYDAGSSGGNDGASSRATARYMTPQALGKLRSSVPYPPAESLSRVILRSTPSSKFNWIISEVLAYSSRDKFIVFSRDTSALAHLLEIMLDVLRIQAVYVGSAQTDPKKRADNIRRFKEELHVRVLLLELKHGARGLDLPNATRVIFCEPCFSRDEELQAIKRAHRIGSRRPVFVQTLAARGTNEEALLSLVRAVPPSYPEDVQGATRQDRGQQNGAPGLAVGGKMETLLANPTMRRIMQEPSLVQPPHAVNISNERESDSVGNLGHEAPSSAFEIPLWRPFPHYEPPDA